MFRKLGRSLPAFVLALSGLAIATACVHRNNAEVRNASGATANDGALCAAEEGKVAQLEAELRVISKNDSSDWTEDQCAAVNGYITTSGSARFCQCYTGHQRLTPAQIKSGNPCAAWVDPNAAQWTDAQCASVDGSVKKNGNKRRCLCKEGARELTPAQITSQQSCKTPAEWTEAQCKQVGGYTATNGSARNCLCGSDSRVLKAAEVTSGLACNHAAGGSDSLNQWDDGGLTLAGRSAAEVKKELEQARVSFKRCKVNANKPTQPQASGTLLSICSSIGGVIDGNFCVCGDSGLSQALSTLQSDNGASCAATIQQSPMTFEQKCTAVGGRLSGSLCQCGTHNSVNETTFNANAGDSCRKLTLQNPFASTDGPAVPPPATGCVCRWRDANQDACGVFKGSVQQGDSLYLVSGNDFKCGIENPPLANDTRQTDFCTWSGSSLIAILNGPACQ